MWKMREIRLKEDPDYSVGKLMSLLHKSAHGKRFAVGFPEYKIGSLKEAPSLGSVVHVFSPECAEAMDLFRMDNPQTEDEKALHIFLLSWAKLGPVENFDEKEVQEWVLFKISNPHKKLGDAYRERMERRREAQTARKPPGVEKQAATVNSTRRKLPVFFHVSESTHQPMKVFVEKRVGNAGGNPSFNSFGLGRVSECCGGVPARKPNCRPASRTETTDAETMFLAGK